MLSIPAMSLSLAPRMASAKIDVASYPRAMLRAGPPVARPRGCTDRRQRLCARLTAGTAVLYRTCWRKDALPCAAAVVCSSAGLSASRLSRRALYCSRLRSPTRREPWLVRHGHPGPPSGHQSWEPATAWTGHTHRSCKAGNGYRQDDAHRVFRLLLRGKR